MIIEPASLQDMEKRLRAIPSEKRRLIITVGRHPNEGTARIANQEHEYWERYGAAVVQIPRHWTPHGFWTQVVQNYRDYWPVDFDRLGAWNGFVHRFDTSPQKEKLLRVLKRIPDDLKLVSFLSRRGFDVPVINFHGMPAYFEPHYDPITSEQLSSHPQFIIIQSKHGSRIPRHEKIRFEMEENKTGITHENALTVELGFHGKKPELSADLRNLSGRLASEISAQLVPSYLNTFEDYADSDLLKQYAKHRGDFESLLAHLSKAGLSRRPLR